MAARVPLVLLPALLCDDGLYRAQLDVLGDLADARVIVTAEPSLARSAHVVLSQAPPRFALGGTSAGGISRWRSWPRRPSGSSASG